MIKQIKFVSIPVADQNRALDFYTDKLGFTIITDQPFDEKQRWIELRVPKAETRVVLFTPNGDEKRIDSFMNMSYACDDIDKTYAELKKRGVEFEGPPAETAVGHLRDVQRQRRQPVRGLVVIRVASRIQKFVDPVDFAQSKTPADTAAATAPTTSILHEMQKSHDITVVTLA